MRLSLITHRKKSSFKEGDVITFWNNGDADTNASVIIRNSNNPWGAEYSGAFLAGDLHMSPGTVTPDGKNSKYTQALATADEVVQEYRANWDNVVVDPSNDWILTLNNGNK
ncbi:Protein of unknown function [Lactobacillus hominis DSM 23910 = CRBIP 24.179]|uniref:Uncharacterized protein n=2 Tax=Lactobacillus hominis TaxID=1203033 RepID=I7JUQ3_9LACO|nr:hypothetical protein [Lactobacillus hominis]CCI81596.1 Protein of unknown function [Lactobacillus hominis DSM 23910 = CRBIP 24.179]